MCSIQKMPNKESQKCKGFEVGCPNNQKSE